MNVSSVSNTAFTPSAQQSNAGNNWQQLTQALQSGNLSAAQQAYATLTQSAGNLPGGQNGPLAQALSKIGAALQSGDIGGAQQALTQLQQQAASKPHHHHHGKPPAATTTALATSDSTDTSATGGVDITA